jgi:hypothetical protein
MKYLIPLILLASPVFAQEQPTLQKCEALISSYVRLKIDVEQAGLALNIQKGIVEVCQKLIEAEKPKPTPEPEEPKAEEAK